MRGKRAKELRKAARQLLGKDAPHADYDTVQQRGKLGEKLRPVQYTRDTGRLNGQGEPITEPVMARIWAEYFDLGKWHWVRCKINTGMPIFKTLGVELRLKLSSVKGMTNKFKSAYRRKRREGALA